MHTHLIKTERIIKGTAQLFTAMDKGFAKVESDLTLLSRFRTICYNANQKLEEVIPVMQKHIERLAEVQDDSAAAEIFKKELYSDLLTIRNIISSNIISVTEYIDDFSELWKKSFSFSALLKFKLLLINEYTLLEREIQNIEMDYLLIQRVKKINLHQPAKKVAEGTGL